MKLKAKISIGTLGALSLILMGAMLNNYLNLEKDQEKHLQGVEQKVMADLDASVKEANILAKIEAEKARETLKIQLLNKVEKEKFEEQRKAEIRDEELQKEKEKQEQITEERRKFQVSIAFDKEYEASSNCINPSSSMRKTMCINERRKAKVEFEKKWHEQHGL